MNIVETSCNVTLSVSYEALTVTLWKLLETAVGLLLCEKVAMSTLVPGDVAMRDTFFSIFSY